MYRIAICEDDATTREQIASLCGEILARLDTEHAISEFDCAEALEGALEAGASFDLLCLDIMLQGKTGVEMAQAFRTRDDQTSILLISSSREFLKEGYSVRPLQYLYKPVDPRELEEVLRTDLRLHRRAARLTLSLGGKTRVLPLSELLYVESQNHNAVACFPDRQEGFRITLSERAAAARRSLLPLSPQLSGEHVPHPTNQPPGAGAGPGQPDPGGPELLRDGPGQIHSIPRRTMNAGPLPQRGPAFFYNFRAVWMVKRSPV